MITNKFLGIREVVLGAVVMAALFLAGASMTFAQTTTFTPPSGYDQIGMTGIYYNDATGLYYNPMTGQYTNLQPIGEAQRDSSGNYIVASGYDRFGTTNYYYNSTTGYYYDPMTGFYSTTAPVNTGVTATMAQNYTPGGTNTGGTGGNTGGGTFTPGVPNTGVGDSVTTLITLALLAIAAIGGAVALGRRAA